MEFTGLKDKYVSVSYAEGCSYGGNQSRSGSKVIAKCGCGVVAAADVFLYLRGRTSEPISAEEYNSYLKSLMPGYFQIIPPVGMNALTLCTGVNLYFRIHSMPYYARWGASRQKFYSVMEGMLENDIPVILAIGENFPLFWQKNRLDLYRRNADFSYTAVSSTLAHFVTVTGMDGMWMRVSSWGKEYYINRNEFFRYVDDHSSRIISNILVIKVRRK